MKYRQVALRAVLLSTVSVFVLSIDVSAPANAQQASPLPPVTIDAPRPQARRATAPSRRAAARGPVRRQTVQPLQRQEPVRYVTPSTGTIGAPSAPYAGGQVGSGTRVGFLGNRSVFDTPFNTIGYTDKLNRDQQSRSIADVVANDPSVRSILSRGTAGEQFVIRGFRVFPNDVGFDGLFGLAAGRRQPIEGIERVEILKGPSALVSGVPVFGNIGGTINLIPKRAPLEDINRMTAGYASNSQIGSHVDVSRRYGDNKEFGVRFNGAYRNGELAVDNNRVGLGVTTLGLDYHGDRFRLSGDVSYHKQDIKGIQNLYTVPANIQIPRAPDGKINASQPWEFFEQEHVLGTVRAEYDVADATTIYAAAGTAKTSDLFLNGTVAITDVLGNFSQGIMVSCCDYRGNTAEVGLRSQFETGPVSHRFTTAAVGIVTENTSIPTTFLGSPILSNIYTPIRVPERTFGGLSARVNRQNENSGVAIADTMSIFDERVQLTVGGRAQRIEVKNFNVTNGALTSQFDRSEVTPAVAIVVKPIAGLSLYANYIEGLQAGSIAPTSAINSGESTPPFVTQQIEVGAKYDFGFFGMSLAAFEITQPSAFTNPVTRRFAVDGEQRNRGIEFNVFGEPLPGFRLLGGVSFLEGVLTKTVGGTNDGRTAPGVPDVQFNLYGEYDLPFMRGVTVTGRVIYTAKQFYDQANTQSIPDWTRVDLGARYTTTISGKLVTFRAAVENVFGLDYFASSAGGFLTQGSPRTYLVSASFDF